MKAMAFCALATGFLFATMGCEGTSAQTPPATSWGAGQWQPPQQQYAPTPAPAAAATPASQSAQFWVGKYNGAREPLDASKIYELPTDAHILLGHSLFRTACNNILGSVEVKKEQHESICIVTIRGDGKQIGQAGVATVTTSTPTSMVTAIVRYVVTAPVHVETTTGIAFPIKFPGEFQ